MIVFRVAQLAKEKGLTGYAINKKLKAAHPSVGYRLLEVDEQDSIGKDTIERICTALDCEPGDFIVRVPDETPVGKTTKAAKKSSKK